MSKSTKKKVVKQNQSAHNTAEKKDSLVNQPQASARLMSENAEQDMLGDSIERIQIQLDLYNRLLKTKVLGQSQRGTTILAEQGTVMLNEECSSHFANGLIFGCYLRQLKQMLKRRENQDLNINEEKIGELQGQNTVQAKMFNWNIVCTELDKIGVTVDNDIRGKLVQGDISQITTLYSRLERYMAIIAGQDFLKFDETNTADLQSMQEVFAKPLSIGSSEDPNILVSNQMKSLDENQRSSIDHHTASQETIPVMNEVYIYEEGNMISARGQTDLPLSETIKKKPRDSSPTRQKRVVKEGVVIQDMDPSKPLDQSNSSFEMILSSLSHAFSMKPRQSAALLTNNSQYLIHACVRGVKDGLFEPVLSWYGILLEQSRVLTELLEAENENFPNTATAGFIKVLSTISCGFYSHNTEVVARTFKLVNFLITDFKYTKPLYEQAMSWFLKTKDADKAGQQGGLTLCLHAMKKHSEMAKPFVELIDVFCTVDEQVSLFYKDEIFTHAQSMGAYITVINDLLPFLFAIRQRTVIQQGLVDYWIEICAREAENDGQHTTQNRISAITLLCELWITFTDYVDSKEIMINAIVFMMKRAVRDTSKTLRIISISQFFRILDKFSFTKNPSAPLLYKTLVFSLVESPNDLTIRELMYHNFMNLFEDNMGVPIGLLIDPLFKFIQNQQGSNFQARTLDFDFFLFIAKHPKLSSIQAAELVNILSKYCLNDIGYAQAAAAPFIQLISRYSADLDCEDFIKQCIDALLELEHIRLDPNSPQKKGKKTHETRLSALQAGFDMKDANMIAGDFRKQEQKGPDNVDKRIRKALLVQVLIKMQNLQINDISKILLERGVMAQQRYVDTKNASHKGLAALIACFPDGDRMNAEISSTIKLRTSGNQLRASANNSSLLEAGLTTSPQRKSRQVPSSLSVASSAQFPDGLNGSRKRLADISPDGNHMAIVPYKGGAIKEVNQTGMTSAAQARGKALEHIAKLKKQREQKEQEGRQKQEQGKVEEERKKRKLKEQIEKRKIALGVQTKGAQVVTVGQLGHEADQLALVYRGGEDHEPAGSGSFSSKRRKKGTLMILDLDDEEDRDKEAVNEFMKRYAKLWRNLFSKYQNVGHKQTKIYDFDKMADAPQQLTAAEVTKLMKDMDSMPQLLSKDEINTLIKGVNTKLMSKRHDLLLLDFQGYVAFLIQFALNGHSRDPQDLRHYPPVESLQALVNRFEKATRDKGQSTLLFENPDIDPADSEMIKTANEKLEQDPNFPIPEGYIKTKEKTPVYTYNLPAKCENILGNGAFLATQILDELVSDLFGIHFIEPTVTYVDKFKLRKAIQKVEKPVSKAPALSYMQPLKGKIRAMKSPNPVSQSYSSNRTGQAKVGGAIEENKEPLALGRLRGNSQASSRLEQTPEEIARIAAEKKKKAEIVRESLKRMEDERERKKNEVDKLRQREELAKKEKDQRFKQERARRIEANKKALEERKDKDEKDREGERKANEEKQKEVEESKRKEQLEVMRRAKAGLRSQFRGMSKQREQLAQKEADLKRLKDEQQVVLKQRTEEHIKQTKDNRQKERELYQDILSFLDQPDVQKIISNNHASLQKYFKFYANEGKQEIGVDLEIQMNMMGFREFVKFGYQTKIVPVLANSEDIVQSFRQVARQTVNEEQSASMSKNFQSQFTQLSKAELSGASAKEKIATNYFDFEAFKAALVRITIIASEVLGGQSEEQLQKKINIEAKKREQEEKQKARAKRQEDERKRVESEVLEEMRQEYEKKMKQIKNAVSRSPTKMDGDQIKLSNKTRQSTTNLEAQKSSNSDLPIAKSLAEQSSQSQAAISKSELLKKAHKEKMQLGLEEQEFQRWIGQQEALGTGLQQRVQAKLNTQGKQETLSESGPQSALLQKKQTLTAKQLKSVESTAATISRTTTKTDIRDHTRVVAKELDVETISADTFQRLMKFIGCETNENGMDQRLKNLNRQKSLPGAKQSPVQKSTFAGLGTIRETDGDGMEETLDIGETRGTEETREKQMTAVLNEDSDDDIQRALLQEEQNTDRNSQVDSGDENLVTEA